MSKHKGYSGQIEMAIRYCNFWSECRRDSELYRNTTTTSLPTTVHADHISWNDLRSTGNPQLKQILRWPTDRDRLLQVLPRDDML